MVKRDDLLDAIESLIGVELIAKARLRDIYSNGVQIHGSEEVKKIALGVSMTHDFLTEAVASGAQFCLTHHGLDLTSHNIVTSRIHPGLQRDLKYIFDNKLTVAGYHYCLDAQPDFGNNVSLIHGLGATPSLEPFFDEWGYVATFKKPIKAQELASKLASLTSHDVFSVYGGPEYVSRLGVCSGGAKPYDKTLWEVIDKRLDAIVSGEIIEASVGQAMGVGYTYLAAGHYATEVFGVQELGKRIKSYYGDKLEVEFIDIPNPL